MFNIGGKDLFYLDPDDCRAKIIKEEKHNERNRRRRISVVERANKIKRDAKYRNYIFTIDIETIKIIIIMNCFYCGQTRTNSYLNGVDRVRNDIGYLFDNCIPCCKICNLMKHVKSIDNFIKIIKHISAYHFPDKFKKVTYPEVFISFVTNESHKTAKQITYKQHKKKIKKENTLTKKQYNTLMNGTCYYCNQKEFFNGNKIGIDRINNNGIYEIDNCVSCCSCCNYLKGRNDQNIFLEKVLKISLHIGDNYQEKLDQQIIEIMILNESF